MPNKNPPRGGQNGDACPPAATEPPKPDDIRSHSGNKYIRCIRSCIPGRPSTDVDVYSVLTAFNVTCPGIAHAVKKLLCAGVRGKADIRTDLTEAIDAIRRAIELNTPPSDTTVPVV